MGLHLVNVHMCIIISLDSQFLLLKLTSLRLFTFYFSSKFDHAQLHRNPGIAASLPRSYETITLTSSHDILPNTYMQSCNSAHKL